MPVCVENGCKRFSVRKLDAHPPAYVPLLETARVHRHGPSSLLDGGNVVEGTDVNKMAGNRGGGGHDRADEMRAAVFALAALEIAIAGAGAALVRRQYVGVHADAHAAAGVAPLETGRGENFIEAFF